MTDFIAAIETIIENGDDPWEALVSAGIQVQDHMDAGRWLIGDAALLVAKEYGKNRIAEYAKNIKVPVKRVMEYRTVCAFWDRQFSARAEILSNYPNITYTHMRFALRLKDMEDAMDFIMECVANDWTPERAEIELIRRLGRPTPPRKLVDCAVELSGVVKVANEDMKNNVAFWIEPFDLQMLEPLDIGRRYRLAVYEVKDEDESA